MHKTVLITGCSSGLGFSMTNTLLADGWQVIATVRSIHNSQALHALQHPLLKILQLDVTNTQDIEEIKQFIKRECNNELDCLINNAGFGLFGAVEDLTEQEVRYQLDVNLFGIIFLTQACLPALRNRQGRILNISSVMGYLPFPMQSMYVTSKYALEGFSESLYYELIPHRIQVSLVEPGAFNTKFGLNAKMPLTPDRDGIYQKQYTILSKFRNMVASKKNHSPDEFAEKIKQLLKKSKMPLKKRVGFDAHIIYYVKKILPDCLFYYLLKIVYQHFK